MHYNDFFDSDVLLVLHLYDYAATTELQKIKL